MSLRVGTDLVLVETIRSSIDAHGAHYLERVYTQRELDDCNAIDGLDAERLAARFAAKEATMKVLRPGDEAVPWNTIEVRRDGRGSVEVQLSGAAARLASDAGMSELSVSLTHEGELAAAVVVASCSQAASRPVRY
jgi:holo-[acyl-carrier protein] synthase